MYPCRHPSVTPAGRYRTLPSEKAKQEPSSALPLVSDDACRRFVPPHMQPAEVRRAMAFGVDVGVTSLASGRVSAHAVVDRASMDFFETASAIEKEVADAEEQEARERGGGWVLRVT